MVEILFHRIRFIQANPCSSVPPCLQTGREFLFRNGLCWISCPVAVLFSARQFPRIKVLRALDQEMGEARKGEEDMRS